LRRRPTPRRGDHAFKRATRVVTVLTSTFEETFMSLGTILLILLILMLIGAIPSWPHSKSWGYGPSGGIGLVVVIVIVLLVLGRI
jgi:hypothetical protein